MKFPSIATLDREFSKFIRLRDSQEFDGHAFRCITCKQVKPYEQADAGHFLGRQYYATRWNPINVQAQCRFDNRFNEGMKDVFKSALVSKYGLHEIEGMIALHKRGRKPKPFECVEILARIKSDLAAL